MKVAIADDDAIVCSSLTTILQATGVAQVAWTAADGVEALERYRSGPAMRPDVMLIDIQMPGMDGLEAARRMLEFDKAARILFLTTFADKSYIDQAMALGAKGYLIKQDVASVAPAVQAVMAGQIVLGAEVLGKLTGVGAERSVEKDGRSPLSQSESSAGTHNAPSVRAGNDNAGGCSHDITINGGDSATDKDLRLLHSLSDRERDVAALVAEGFDNREIAAQLFLSEGTVRNRISNILDKLHLSNRTQLAILWLRQTSHRTIPSNRPCDPFNHPKRA
ncbi:response regulator transcription factor [Bifidobacterium eulemuris]|uniref:DNA-binding response regulator n=1 Tax=Bifidobacterium eulemuris TaxID=1765219 RepID=A0A261GD17_9BIFI|nr:response regulator transcription factor [Bifidobacterium eulemuris]OZG69310.1 DNA-binding response regulator [Bifidobacterium eulemuris]QOL31190.1 response regulator transcription factor [Bifidobacterium eulemuris]